MAIHYGDWPTRSVPPVDKVAEHRQKLFEALRNEVGVLDGRPRSRGRPLTSYKNGRIHCCLRVAGKLMPVDDDGHLAAIADSPEEAKEWIEQQMVKIQAGEYDERIRKHPASIPPRRKRKEVANDN